jgi:hypothetical protein
MLELEGTWEEILTHAPELAGRRVRVTVVDAGENGQDTTAPSPAQQFAAALRDLEADEEMPLTPSGENTLGIIREGRLGAMYGSVPLKRWL